MHNKFSKPENCKQDSYNDLEPETRGTKTEYGTRATIDDIDGDLILTLGLDRLLETLQREDNSCS